MDETAATFLLWLCNNRKVHIFFLSHFLQWRVKKKPTITLRGVSVCMCEEFQCHSSHIIICFGSQNRGRAWMRERLIRAGVDSRCPHCCLDQARHIYIIAHKLLDKLKCGMCDAASPPPEHGNKHFAPRLCVARGRQPPWSRNETNEGGNKCGVCRPDHVWASPKEGLRARTWKPEADKTISSKNHCFWLFFFVCFFRLSHVCHNSTNLAPSGQNSPRFTASLHTQT